MPISRALSLLMFAVIVFVPACDSSRPSTTGDESEEPSSQTAQSSMPTTKPALDPTGKPAGAHVIEIQELHHDKFPERLMEDGERFLLPPFWVSGGELVFAAELAEGLTEQLKQDYELVMAPGMEIASSQVIVIHTIRFDGVGRYGTRSRYYVFGESPATVPLGGQSPGDSFEFNIATSGGPFALAVRQIRPLKPGIAVSIEPKDSSEELVLVCDDQEFTLAADGSADLYQNQRLIHISEAPISARELGTTQDATPIELLPGADYGKIQFDVSVTAKYHGRCSIRQHEPAKVEEPKS